MESNQCHLKQNSSLKIPTLCIVLNIGFSVVRKDGRSGGRCTVTRLPNFLGWINFLTHGAPLLALRARKSSAISVALEFFILVGRDFNG